MPEAEAGHTQFFYRFQMRGRAPGIGCVEYPRAAVLVQIPINVDVLKRPPGAFNFRVVGYLGSIPGYLPSSLAGPQVVVV